MGEGNESLDEQLKVISTSSLVLEVDETIRETYLILFNKPPSTIC